MRRIAYRAGILVALSLGLAACGGSSSPSSTTTAPATTTTTVPATTTTTAATTTTTAAPTTTTTATTGSTTATSASTGTTTAASSACQKVGKTLSSIQSVLPAALGNPQQLASKIKGYVTQLQGEAASGSTKLKTAVNAFISDLQAAAGGNINIGKLTTDGTAIGKVCAGG